jgi:hypothetical protein
MPSWLRNLAIVLAVVIFMSLLGFRVGHPQSGLNSAVGSAESSIVLYRQTEKLAAGDRVLVDIGDPNLSPATSIIRNIEDDEIDVQAGELLVSVKTENIQGKILALVPLVGSILSIFGL